MCVWGGGVCGWGGVQGTRVFGGWRLAVGGSSVGAAVELSWSSEGCVAGGQNAALQEGEGVEGW